MLKVVRSVVHFSNVVYFQGYTGSGCTKKRLSCRVADSNYCNTIGNAYYRDLSRLMKCDSCFMPINSRNIYYVYRSGFTLTTACNFLTAIQHDFCLGGAMVVGRTLSVRAWGLGFDPWVRPFVPEVFC